MEKGKVVLCLLVVLGSALLASCDMAPATPSAPSGVNDNSGVVTLPQENLPPAREALISFFAALNEGRYADAAALYGETTKP